MQCHIFSNPIDITYDRLKNRVNTVLFNVGIFSGCKFLLYINFQLCKNTSTLCFNCIRVLQRVTNMKLIKTSNYGRVAWLLSSKWALHAIPLQKIMQKSIRTSLGCETNCFKPSSNCTYILEGISLVKTQYSAYFLILRQHKSLAQGSPQWVFER